MEETDEMVVLRVRAGDKEAFGVLILRYETKLLRYARKFLLFNETGEDLVQDVFIKAYVNLNSFNAEKRFSPWLYRIAHNEFINELKRRGRAPLPFFDTDTIFPHPVANETSDGPTQDAETKRMLDAVIGELSPKYREPLLLCFFEEMSYEDIADVLQIPTSTVGVRIKRGKDRLRDLYEQAYGAR